MDFARQDELLRRIPPRRCGLQLTSSGAFNTQSANVHFWAVGAAQYLDNAETMLYLVYQHTDGDVLVGQRHAEH